MTTTPLYESAMAGGDICAGGRGNLHHTGGRRVPLILLEIHQPFEIDGFQTARLRPHHLAFNLFRHLGIEEIIDSARRVDQGLIEDVTVPVLVWHGPEIRLGGGSVLVEGEAECLPVSLEYVVDIAWAICDHPGLGKEHFAFLVGSSNHTENVLTPVLQRKALGSAAAADGGDF